MLNVTQAYICILVKERIGSVSVPRMTCCWMLVSDLVKKCHSRNLKPVAMWSLQQRLAKNSLYSNLCVTHRQCGRCVRSVRCCVRKVNLGRAALPQIHPPKLPLSLRRSPLPSNTPIPRPTPLTTWNGIRIRSAILSQYTFLTDRQTDRLTQTHTHTDGLGDRSVTRALCSLCWYTATC